MADFRGEYDLCNYPQTNDLAMSIEIWEAGTSAKEETTPAQYGGWFKRIEGPVTDSLRGDNLLGLFAMARIN